MLTTIYGADVEPFILNGRAGFFRGLTMSWSIVNFLSMPFLLKANQYSICKNIHTEYNIYMLFLVLCGYSV